MEIPQEEINGCGGKGSKIRPPYDMFFKASFNKFQRICNMQKRFSSPKCKVTKTSLMYFGIIIIKKPLKIKQKPKRKSHSCNYLMQQRRHDILKNP